MGFRTAIEAHEPGKKAQKLRRWSKILGIGSQQICQSRHQKGRKSPSKTQHAKKDKHDITMWRSSRHAGLFMAACAGYGVNPGTSLATRLNEAPFLTPKRTHCAAAAPKKVKVALCQITSGADKPENLRTAQRAVETAVKNGAELVVLPECWNSPYDTKAFRQYSESAPGGESSKLLASLAAKHKIWLVGGSIPEIDEGGKVYNTSLVYNPQGKPVAKHRKVHLFDIDIPGKITFRESDTLTAGDSVTTFDSPWGKVGVGICYDIRFPELAMLMRREGAKIMIYPGAFNMTTGPRHWELLQRARATDNQVFVLAASPARNMESNYHAWGHSTVVDPWGAVLATTEHEDTILYATLDLSQIDEVRAGIPISRQGRPDMYNMVDLTKKK